MEDAAFKQIEGDRIQRVLGAIGALPAAMLVFGDGPAVSAAGAPLFATAIVLVVGALMHWNFTDQIFYLDAADHHVAPQHQGEVDRWRLDIDKFGGRFPKMTYAYAVPSLICSIAGVAAVYSPMRLPVTVNVGFVLALAAAGLMSAEVYRSGRRTSELLHECRRLNNLPAR